MLQVKTPEEVIELINTEFVKMLPFVDKTITRC